MAAGPAAMVWEDPWWRAGLMTVGSLARMLFRLHVTGARHVPDRGAAIVAANHLSVLDPIFVALAAASRGRTVRFLGVASVFELPVVGWGLRRLGQIPIRRGEGDVAALRHAVDALGVGALVGIFPEGRVVAGPDPATGRRGAARLALASGAPLLPVGVWGAQARWPKGGPRRGLPLRPPVTVSLGLPIEPENGEDAAGLTTRLMDAIGDEVRRARAHAAGDA